MDWNTRHFRQRFIFFSQLSCASPSQIVPLMNQQRCPSWNSQAGHWRFFSTGHFRMFQHRPFVPPGRLLCARRNNICRSIWAGILLQPCSKLCTALSEVPNNCAICFWVLPSWLRILEKSSFFNCPFPLIPFFIPQCRLFKNPFQRPCE
jgi:hypothetical protein